jgi:phosphoribosyl 1,2-cyclic phosphodiesterase
MSLFISSLNSGSNGNCYYIGNEKEAVFVDAGISCKETERRMSRLGLSMDKVKAIFVSHEHTDHISGIPVLAKKYGLPVYITNQTLVSSGMDLSKSRVFSFEAHRPVLIGGLSVTAFPKFHDASDPHSFVISFNGTNVGIFTDIGNNCNHVISHFKKCHAVFLEANYDEDMLANGSYPIHLKRRISSSNGHLSNAQALELFLQHKPSFMRYLLLSHLSKENNCPNLVNELFRQHAGDTSIVIASRYQETAVYTIDRGDYPAVALPVHQRPAVQLQLSF